MSGSSFISQAEGNYAIVELELLTFQQVTEKCFMYFMGMPTSSTAIIDHQLCTGLNCQWLESERTLKLQDSANLCENRVDSHYVSSSRSLRKGFFQKLEITYKGGNASFKLSLHYCLYSVKVIISFLNFWQKTFLKVLKKSFKTSSYSRPVQIITL